VKLGILSDDLLMLFRQYLEESMGQEAAGNAASGGIAAGEKTSRSTLEDAARESTLKGHGTPEERFWQRQQGQAETIAIGKNYIAKVCTSPKS
jgi:anoctamin-10